MSIKPILLNLVSIFNVDNACASSVAHIGYDNLSIKTIPLNKYQDALSRRKITWKTDKTIILRNVSQIIIDISYQIYLFKLIHSADIDPAIAKRVLSCANLAIKESITYSFDTLVDKLIAKQIIMMIKSKN